MRRLLRSSFMPALLAILCVSCSNNTQIAFDSAAWKAVDYGENNHRFRMVDSLSKQLKTGMPQSQVHEQLGKPETNSDESADWLKSKAPFDAYQTRFYINLIDYDTDYFIIQYDSDNKLLSTQTVTVPG